MLWENAAVHESCDVCQCTSLFKNAFKIKGTPERNVKASKSRRIFGGMTSQRLFTPERINKENGSAISSPLSRINSPQKPQECKARNPLEDYDPNSQDGGYGSRDGFQFTEPLGVAPRRMSLEPGSSLNSPLRPQKHRCIRSPILRSLSSGYESTDDGFNDLIDMESLDESSIFPSNMANLLSGDIVNAEKSMDYESATTPEFPRTKSRTKCIRRSLSLQNEKLERSHDSDSTPPMSKVRSCLFRSPNSNCSALKLSFDDRPRSATKKQFRDSKSPYQARSCKRAEHPGNESPVLVKRPKKSTSFQDVADASEENSMRHSPISRSLSEIDSHSRIKQAIHRSLDSNDLTGDFSKACALPLAEGRHIDLKAIKPETLVSLMNGDFKDCVNSFKIVDCRYPYEFVGGHINGAVNLYTKDQIEQFLLDPLTNKPEIEVDVNKRDILVFHCEFSWERGPTLSRFLRSIDRQRNKDLYPALHYPEMYLLDGGYKNFYQAHRELCTPKGYIPMRHPENEADMKQFRSKSKSWQGEKTRTNVIAKGNLKRLGF